MASEHAYRDWQHSDPYYSKPTPQGLLGSPTKQSPSRPPNDEIFGRSPKKAIVSPDSRRRKTDIAPYNDGSPLSAHIATLNRPAAQQPAGDGDGRKAGRPRDASVRTKVSEIAPYFDGSLAGMPGAYHELAHRAIGEPAVHLVGGGSVQAMPPAEAMDALRPPLRPSDHEIFPRAVVYAHPCAGEGRDATHYYPAGSTEITGYKGWQGTEAPNDPDTIRRRVTDATTYGNDVFLSPVQNDTRHNPNYVAPPSVVGAAAASDLQVRVQPYTLEEANPSMFRRNTTEATNPRRFHPQGDGSVPGGAVLYTDIHPQSHIHPRLWGRSQRPMLEGIEGATAGDDATATGGRQQANTGGVAGVMGSDSSHARPLPSHR